MSVLLWIIAAGWAAVFFQFLLNRLLVPDIGRVPARGGPWPSVSIVVPARNEAAHIREAVSSFLSQDYPDIEVVVVDDRSSDRTPAILAELSAENRRLRVVRGDDPPAGWLGKPHALETGRRIARGEWLLFVDADVIYAPDVVRRAMTLALRDNADMITLGARFVTSGVIEPVVLSTLHLAGFAVFPAWLVSRSRSPWIAAGTGTFNLVRRTTLERAGAFAGLRLEVVDDLALGRRVKAAGGRQTVALSGDAVRLSMYGSGRAAIQGFTKNAFPALGGRVAAMVALMALGGAGNILPYAALIPERTRVPAVLALAFMHATFAGLALVIKAPWFTVFLNPLRELLWWWIMLKSWRLCRTRGIVWRGRSYPLTPG